MRFGACYMIDATGHKHVVSKSRGIVSHDIMVSNAFAMQYKQETKTIKDGISIGNGFELD